jgi:dTMP kinase
MAKRFYGEGLPDIDPGVLKGILIVIEGPDCSGRSTHVQLLRSHLEQKGHAVADVGLKRSLLISSELDQAKNSNEISPRTLSLFYATDFADQLEHTIIPSLQAGYIVIADRYIYTLMVRDLVRGADWDWLESIYGIALVPDTIFFLRVSPHILVERTFNKYQAFTYWESGMDLHFSREWYPCFNTYQRKLNAQFRILGKKYNFQTINGNASIPVVSRELCRRVDELLEQVNH